MSAILDNSVETSGSGDNGWGEWKRYVLETLKHIDAEMIDMRQVLRQHCTMYELRHESLVRDVSALKSRVMTWGAIAVAVVTLVSPFLQDVFARLLR